MRPPESKIFVLRNGAVYAGQMAPPPVLPAWLAGKPLNQWIEIPNTEGAGGASVDAFSGMVLRDDTSEIFIYCAGGHGQGQDNRVVSLPLSADQPAWVLRKAPSLNVPDDVAVCPDGAPPSCHTYSSGAWIPQRNRLMLHGMYGTYPQAYGSRKVRAFNPDTNQWDPDGTFADATSAYSMCRGKNGDVWMAGGSRWNQATDTYTSFSWSRISRFPGEYDSLRDQLFTINFGDSQGYNTDLGLVASKVSAQGVQSPVTFNPSAAYDELLSLQGVYSSMCYVPTLDKFFYYPGAILNQQYGQQDPNTRRIFKITPNSGSVWDIESYTAALGVAPLQNISGTHGRFKYVPALKGIAFLPRQSSPMLFMRTSL